MLIVFCFAGADAVRTGSLLLFNDLLAAKPAVAIASEVNEIIVRPGGGIAGLSAGDTLAFISVSQGGVLASTPIGLEVLRRHSGYDQALFINRGEELKMVADRVQLSRR